MKKIFLNFNNSKSIKARPVISTLRKILPYVFCTIAFFNNQGLYSVKYLVEVLNAKKGLSNNVVTSIFQDQEGYIWFGTYRGLNRFDGRYFQVYRTKDGLINDNIRAIVEDHHSILWVGTKAGLISLQSGKITNYTDKQGLPNPIISALLIDNNNNLIIGTKKGLSVYKNGSFKNFSKKDGLPSNYITTLFLDSKNTIWVGTRRGAIPFKDNKFIKNYSNLNDMPFYIQKITEDKNGNIFLATRNKGFYKFDSLKFNVLNFYKNLNLKHFNQGRVIKDADGNLVFTSFGWGVNIIEDGKYSYFGVENNKLPTSTIWSTYLDREGNIWLGTFGSGICKLYKSKARSIGSKHGLINPNVQSIFMDSKKNIWIGKTSSLSVFLEGKITSIKNFANISLVNSIDESNDGTIWIGTSNGLWIYRNNVLLKSPINNKLPNKVIINMALSKEGSILIHLSNGLLLEYNIKDNNLLNSIALKINFYNMKTDLLSGNFILEATNGSLYTYKRDDGLKKIELPKKLSLIKDISRIHYISQENFIIIADGLWQYKNKILKKLAGPFEFPYDGVNSIAIDKGAGIWIGTNQGVSYFDGKFIQNFDESDGMVGNESFLNSIHVIGNEVWVGSNKGISVFNTNNLLVNSIPPKTVISKIKINNKIYYNRKSITTNYNKNNFEIFFSTLSYTNAAKNRYKYRLEGIDNSLYNDAGNRNFAIYTNLAHGTYLFNVYGTNNEGVWSAKPAQLQIIINPAFYNTNWFYFLAFITTIGIIFIISFTIHRWRIAAIKENEKLLQKKVALRTKELRKERIKSDQARLEIEKLNEFSKKINQTMDLDFILLNVADYILENFDLEGIWILQVDKETKELYSTNLADPLNLISPSDKKFIKEFRVKLEPGLGTFWKIYNRKRVIYINRIPKKMKIKSTDVKILKAFGFNGFINIPLIVQAEVIGIMSLTKLTGNIKLSSNDIKSIARFCEQIAGAIYNSQLYRAAEYARADSEIARATAIIEQAKSDTLLLNILPKSIADELKQKGEVEPMHYESVSVMFTDFKGFTKVSSKMAPDKLIKELNNIFYQFDSISDRYKLEKIKTIGDSYMATGGLPERNTSHPVDICLAAMEIMAFIKQSADIKKNISGGDFWEIRLGIHTGAVMAGVVGKNKFAYDIFGDTVNIASRCESNGVAGRINISADTYKFIKNFFECEYRGEIKVKNRGKVGMYFVNRIHPELSQDESGSIPNKLFNAKYQSIC